MELQCWGHDTYNEEFQSTHSALFSINVQDYSKEKGHTDDNSSHIIRRCENKYVTSTRPPGHYDSKKVNKIEPSQN